MAVACLVCTVVALLLVQDVQSRKLSWTEQEEETHDGLGNHGAAAGRSTTLVSVSLNLPNHCTYCYAMLNTSPLQQSECMHIIFLRQNILVGSSSESCLTVYIINFVLNFDG